MPGHYETARLETGLTGYLRDGAARNADGDANVAERGGWADPTGPVPPAVDKALEPRLLLLVSRK
jgi:hypothetical protein